MVDRFHSEVHLTAAAQYSQEKLSPPFTTGAKRTATRGWSKSILTCPMIAPKSSGLICANNDFQP